MPLTSVLDELDVDPDDVIEDDDLQDEADEAAIEDVGTEDPESVPTILDLPPFGEAQFDLLTTTDLTQGNPETGETESGITLALEAERRGELPVDDGALIDVELTNHFGEFEQGEDSTYPANVLTAFEDGTGSFTIGGADRRDADLTLGPIFDLEGVNDVESIKVDAVDDNVEIVDRTLELEGNSGSTAIEAEWTETIDDR